MFNSSKVTATLVSPFDVFINAQFGQLRTITDEDGNFWFVAKDVAEALGLTNVTEALRNLDEDERSTLRISEGGSEVNIVNEPGFYSFLLRSRKPEAKAFKRWVTHEVLPAIRKHGMYATHEETAQGLTNQGPSSVHLVEAVAMLSSRCICSLPA